MVFEKDQRKALVILTMHKSPKTLNCPLLRQSGAFLFEWVAKNDLPTFIAVAISTASKPPFAAELCRICKRNIE